MSTTELSFQKLADELDARLREMLTTIESGIRCERGDDTVTWRHGAAWGTLTLHETETPPRLQLLLYTAGSVDEQNAVEVAIDDADVIDVLAEPLAGLFRGQLSVQ